MLIIGELINTSREVIKKAVDDRDKHAIQSVAAHQVKAGANYIDVNCGTMVNNEAEVMQWLVETIEEVVSVPLCIDSPSGIAMRAGLALTRNGQPMVNSITAEKERFETILPLILEYKTKVVALCMDDQGVPGSLTDRIRIIHNLVEALTAAGIPREDIYLDPLVVPISTGDLYGLDVLESIRYIRSQFPGVHTTCGLSNISYGLPNRKVLNQVFMIQTMSYGMDSFILDPLDKGMMGFLYASMALIGKDPFCAEFIRAHRSGLYS